jgi:hypothetical protein
MAKFNDSNICYHDRKTYQTLADKGKAFERKRRKAMGLKVEHTYDCQVAGGFRRRLKLQFHSLCQSPACNRAAGD